MSEFEAVIADIQDLRIQGAASIARAGLEALAAEIARARPAAHPQVLRARLLAARPNEPMLRNLVDGYLSHLRRDGDWSTAAAQEIASGILETLADEERRIAEVASRLLEGKRTVFTHCHSSTVTRAIRLAADQGAQLTVYCTETRPRYQGRLTATELAGAGVDVVHLVDSAALLALREAEIFLLGADALLATGFFVNKIGSGLLALAAERLEVPLYVCCHTLKFDLTSQEGHDEPIEERDVREVWADPPRGVRLRNPAFERISIRSVEAFVTEQGLLDFGGVQAAASRAGAGS